jgi:hypothetical protein
MGKEQHNRPNGFFPRRASVCPLRGINRLAELTLFGSFSGKRTIYNHPNGSFPRKATVCPFCGINCLAELTLFGSFSGKITIQLPI